MDLGIISACKYAYSRIRLRCIVQELETCDVRRIENRAQQPGMNGTEQG